MIRLALVTFLTLASVCGAAAQSSDGFDKAAQDAWTAAYMKAQAMCASQPASADIAKDTKMTFSITGWTGGCAEGKRDGFGTLSSRQQPIMLIPDPFSNLGDAAPLADMGSTLAEIASGTFVQGERAGLWCTTDAKSVNTRDGAITPMPMGCRLFSGNMPSGLYRKEADGRWRALTDKGTDAEPAAYVAAGGLEAQSDKLIEAARSGKAAAPAQIAEKTQGLDDLVQGGVITMAIDRNPIPLASKRVAIILSTRALDALSRFRAMRQALIDNQATAKTGDSAVLPFGAGLLGGLNPAAGGTTAPPTGRAEFIRLSAPEQFLTGIASAVDANGARTFAADDLSVLKDGSADYAQIVDWNFTGDFNLDRKAFDSLPACDKNKPPGCGILFEQSVTAWLVNPRLQAVRSFDDAPYPGSARDFVAKASGDLFAGYFTNLARYFRNSWDLQYGMFHNTLQFQLAH